MADLLIVGAGLIGASIGLAVADDWDVVLRDASSASLKVAVERGAGRVWDGVEPAALAVVAVPPSATSGVLRDLLQRDVAAAITHVCSVQSQVQRDVAMLDVSAQQRVCGGHPMAGREVSGPAGARADLFVGRPWAVCPSLSTAPESVLAVQQLAQLCRAEPVSIPVERHDTLVALVSHLPQLAASAVAARLLDYGPSLAALAGPGLVDTTRIAASDPALWTDVLRLNAAEVAPLVRALAEDLLRVSAELEHGGSRDTSDVNDLLRRGNSGRALVPVKRGHAQGDFATLSVSVADQPGELARLLADAATAGVNVEDVRVEHIPGRQRGVIELLLPPAQLDLARRHLAGLGWPLVPD